MSSEQLLKYVQFSSCVDTTFWHKLAQLKLDVDRLDEPVHNIWGYYNNVAPRGLNGVLSVDCSSFNLEADDAGVITVGTVINKSTMEGFREIDKTDFLKHEGEELVKSIKEQALENPKCLTRFSIICFADLKKHIFTYWFAFPALNIVTARLNEEPVHASNVFSEKQLQSLCQRGRNLNFFVLKLKEDSLEFYSVKDGFSKIEENCGWYIGFADSTSNEKYPGWPLRNYLALFAYHCPQLLLFPVKVICLRLDVENGTWCAGKSLVLNLNLSVTAERWNKTDVCVGWERNDRGKYGPRICDLHSSMDPLSLAESSVDLNLKLMKWQVVPDLDLNIIQKTQCLLLGAGTLGCAVARSLLAWGVRHITFVDNSCVSYSNPVRQNLFKYMDVGKAKASAAANALKEIFPPVTSEGITLSIPMPGHPVGDSVLQETKDSVASLDELIRSHDVIFLLMDSRESRWLPTVIGAAQNKIVINAALGFDSYLVMRHGVKTADSCESNVANIIHGSSLGCYFCSDVTAPGNSGQARTLDQQCTVTRPGVSNIAGSLAVELLVSLLQHPSGINAPAYTVQQDDTDCILGMVPHSIRGFLSRFQTILPAVEAFASCVACSPKVIQGYKEEKFDFVLKVLQSKAFLEELTGLAQLHQDSLLTDMIELSSDEDS